MSIMARRHCRLLLSGRISPGKAHTAGDSTATTAAKTSHDPAMPRTIAATPSAPLRCDAVNSSVRQTFLLCSVLMRSAADSSHPELMKKMASSTGSQIE